MRMKTIPSIFIALALPGLVHAELPQVQAVKVFPRSYPNNSVLKIPFHGCVQLSRPLPPGQGEYWLSLDKLTTDEDFEKIEVLVNAGGGIVGGRAVFRGSGEEWEGARGYAARLRVLEPFADLDEPISKALPLAYDGNGFGEMVYTFDTTGNASWRRPPQWEAPAEAAYIKATEKHNRTCEECKPGTGLPHVVLSLPAKAPEPKAGKKP